MNPSVVAATSRRATISCGTPPAILFNGRNISVDDLLQVDAKDMLSNISETYKKLDDCCGKSANININAPELSEFFLPLLFDGKLCKNYINLL